MKPLLAQKDIAIGLQDMLAPNRSQLGKIGSPTPFKGEKTKTEDGPSFADHLMASLEQNRAMKNESLPRKSSLDLDKNVPQKSFSAPKRIEPQNVDAKKPAMKLDAPNEKTHSKVSERSPEPSMSRGTTDLQERGPGFVSPPWENTDLPSKEAVKAVTGEVTQALTPLKQQLNSENSKEGFLNGNPLLAFVSGRLDKLDPNGIASLISDSPFMRQALDVKDVRAFLQSELPIGDLVKLFEIDQGLLNKASAQGLDPSALASMSDFLFSLGIDPGKVAAELSKLQQKLPAEGLKSYIDKANALSAAGFGLSPLGGAKKSGNLSAEQEVGLPQQGSVGTPDLAAVKKQMEGANPELDQRPKVKTQGPASLKENHMNASAFVGASSARPFMSEKTPLGLNEDFFTQDQVQLPKDLFTGNQISDLRALDFSQDVEPGEQGLDFDGKLSVDPFEQMNSEIMRQDVVRVDFGGDGVRQRSLEELLIESQSEKISEINPFRSKIEKSKAITLDEDGELLDLTNTQNFQPSDPSVNAKETLAHSVTQGFSSGESFNEQGQGSERDGSDLTQDRAPVTGVHQNLRSSRPVAEGFINSVREASSTGESQGISQKILAQSQMLLKNGGGSMRVNVETPTLGSVDVAIRLHDNQLDVRILASNDRAHDMISKEVIHLREGLVQHGISLRAVEIGKVADSQGFSSSGQQNFNQQGFANQRPNYDEMKQYVQSFKNSYQQANTPSRSLTERGFDSIGSHFSARSTGVNRLEVRV